MLVKLYVGEYVWICMFVFSSKCRNVFTNIHLNFCHHQHTASPTSLQLKNRNCKLPQIQQTQFVKLSWNMPIDRSSRALPCAMMARFPASPNWQYRTKSSWEKRNLYKRLYYTWIGSDRPDSIQREDKTTHGTKRLVPYKGNGSLSPASKQNGAKRPNEIKLRIYLQL